jgi:hypothetical protein
MLRRPAKWQFESAPARFPRVPSRSRRHHSSGQLGLRGGEAGDRHPVGRARDVIEPDFAAEADRGGVAAVLAADAEL